MQPEGPEGPSAPDLPNAVEQCETGQNAVEQCETGTSSAPCLITAVGRCCAQPTVNGSFTEVDAEDPKDPGTPGRHLGKILSAMSASIEKAPKDITERRAVSESDHLPRVRRWIGDDLAHSLSATFSVSSRRQAHFSVDAFFCCICLEKVPIAQRLVLSECEVEEHGACSSCLKMYLKLRIEEARVDELRCPCAGSDGCEAFVTDVERKAWLSRDLQEKYTRFCRMRDNPKLRACPRCNVLCAPTLDEEGKVMPEMCCQECECGFCYYHSKAHAPGAEACAEYERQMVKQQLLCGGLQGTKACPGCGLRTEKLSGCNHMVCSCKTNWCWACNRKFDNAGWHYNPANPAGCMQFQQELVSPRERRMMVVCKILALPAVLVALIFLTLFVALLIATSWIFPCSFCSERAFKVWIGFSMAIFALPFAAFSVLWGIVSFLIWLLLLPFGCGEIHLQFMLGVPLMTILAAGEALLATEGPECAHEGGPTAEAFGALP